MSQPRSRKLHDLVLTLCLIQPVMDVLSYWVELSGMGNTLTLILRFGVLALMAALGFFLSRKKWLWLTLAGILSLLTAGHVLVCLQYGYGDIVSDLANLLRIYQLPLVTFAFISFCKRDASCLDAIGEGFVGSLTIIILVELLATLTGTDPHTYANKGIGVLGWFSFANAQSAIVSMVIPVAILFVLEKKKLHWGYALIMGLVGFWVLYFFATRLTYASLMATLLGIAVSLFIVGRREHLPVKKACAVFTLLAVAAVVLFPVSPMQKNQQRVSENAVLKQQDIDSLLADSAEEMPEKLRGAYEKYLPGVTGRFGLERTAAHYDYATGVDKLSNSRLQRLSYCQLLLQDQPLARLFGLELGDLTYDDVSYDVENDFHGIFYLLGWTGLGLWVLFLGFFLFRIIRALVKDFKNRFTLMAAGFGIALLCGLAHAFFTAGVLRRPNSNFYLAILLAAIYMLTDLNHTRKEDAVL